MADYNLGQLYLELDVRGEEDLSARLGGIRNGIDAASDAGKTFNQQSRKGYAELKKLASAANEAVPKLRGSFDEGTLSAFEYQKALTVVRSVQDHAAAGGKRLAKMNVETVHALMSAEKAAKSYAIHLSDLLAKSLDVSDALDKAFDSAEGATEDLLKDTEALTAELRKQAKVLGDGDYQGEHFKRLAEQLENTKREAVELRSVLNDVQEIPAPAAPRPAAAPITSTPEVYTVPENPLAYQDPAKIRRAAEETKNAAFMQRLLAEETKDAQAELRRELGILESVDDRLKLAADATEAYYEEQRRLARQAQQTEEALSFELDETEYFEQAAAANAYREELEELSAARLRDNEILAATPDAPAGVPPAPPAPPSPPVGGGGERPKLKQLIDEFDIYKGRIKGGEVSLEEMLPHLEALHSEVKVGAQRWDDNAEQLAKWMKLSGQIGMFRMNPGKDWGLADADEMIGSLEQEFKSLNAELQKTGQLTDGLRDRFARLGEISEGASVGFSEGTQERARLDTVSSRSTKTVADFDAKKTLDDSRAAAAALESQPKDLRAAFDTGNYSAEELKSSLVALETGALEAAEAAREAGTETGRFAAVASSAAKLAKQVKLDPNTNAELTELGNRLVIIEGLYRSGTIASAKFDAQIGELIKDIHTHAKGMDELSDEYREYIALAGKAGNIKTRVGQEELRSSFFSKEFILGNALSNVYGELGIRAVMATSQMIAGLDNLAVAQERARDTASSLRDVVEESGGSYGAVMADIEAATSKYMVLSDSATGAAKSLLEAGYSSDQVRQLLDAVGATAVQRGQDVREAFAEIGNAGDDVEAALTGAVGATETYDRALLRAAGGQQNMVGNLSATQRQAALLSAVMRSSSDALKDYGRNSDGIVGAQMRQAAAAELFRRELGEELEPTVMRVTELGTRMINMATGLIEPLVSAGEWVGRLAGHFTTLEVGMVALAVGGPRAAAGLLSIVTGAGKAGAAVGSLIAMLGGWPVVLAALGVATVAYFADTRSEAQVLADAMDTLAPATERAGEAFETLTKATDKDGLQTAISDLASTMDTEAATAFTDFAENALTSAETTVQAIDLIYAYLAEKRQAAISDSLASIEPLIAQLQSKVEVGESFEDSGEADRLRELIERERDLKAEEAKLRTALDEDNFATDDAYFDARGRYDVVLSELAGVSAEVGRMQSNLWNMGGSGIENLDAENAQLADLLKQRDSLLQQQRQLEATPKQFIERYYKNTGGRGGGDGEGEGEDGPVGDPLADFRDSLNVARAEYNNLKTLMDTGVGDVGFEEVSAGAQGLLGSLDTLIGRMQALNGAGQLAAEQQVELYNLAGERARLVAEINESPNVQRESEAGSWIERLATDAERGRLTWGAAMSEMRKAQQNLSSEFSQFEGLEGGVALAFVSVERTQSKLPSLFTSQGKELSHAYPVKKRMSDALDKIVIPRCMRILSFVYNNIRKTFLTR